MTADLPDGERRRLEELFEAAASGVSAGSPEGVVRAVRRRARRRRGLQVTAALGAVGAAAALGGVTAGDAGPQPGGTETAPHYALTGALRSFGGCPAYLRYVRLRAERLVGPYGLTGPATSYDAPLSLGYLATHRAGAPQTTYAATGGGAASANGPASLATHSGTTDQVAGVDEPDTVKTDGRVIVTLTGPTLRVLSTGARVLGSLQLSGDTGGGMLLEGDRVVVLSATDASQRTGGGAAWPGYRSAPSPAPLPAAPARAAVVDISDPSHPRLKRTFRFSGSFMGVRSVGGAVRLVVGSALPRIDFLTPSTAGGARRALRQNRQLVRHSTLQQWLPRWQSESPDGSSTPWRPLSACQDIARPLNPIGLTTVSVLSLDPAAPAPAPATSVVAGGDVVYATGDHTYLAGVVADGESSGARTRIYEFDTSQARPEFLGAGWIPGTLLNSYAMDETDGYLRAASTVGLLTGRPHTRISVLRLSGRVLQHVGSVGGVGRNEQIRAVRFIGRLAFVVTYRSFDPMFVVDLRDVRRPRVVGLLTQPGFSEFLYPLDPGRLVGVGVSIKRNEPSLLVSTYDVSTPSAPRRLAASVLQRSYGVSGDGYDPHAFLSWPPDHLVVVSYPGTTGIGLVQRSKGAVAYRVGADGSLTRAITLVHRRLAPDRTLIVGDHLWGVTSAGVIVAGLGALDEPPTWHRY